MSLRWKPAVTVAAVIFDGVRFLLVEEETPEGIRLNQPAGHLEANESLLQAVIREKLEETAHDFTPAALVGTYMSRYASPVSGEEITYLRFAFLGELGTRHDRELDTGILRTVWMSLDELQATQALHRSPLVLQCVNDYLSGQRGSLDLLYTHHSALGKAL